MRNSYEYTVQRDMKTRLSQVHLVGFTPESTPGDFQPTRSLEGVHFLGSADYISLAIAKYIKKNQGDRDSETRMRRSFPGV